MNEKKYETRQRPFSELFQRTVVIICCLLNVIFRHSIIFKYLRFECGNNMYRTHNTRPCACVYVEEPQNVIKYSILELVFWQNREYARRAVWVSEQWLAHVCEREYMICALCIYTRIMPKPQAGCIAIYTVRRFPAPREYICCCNYNVA